MFHLMSPSPPFDPPEPAPHSDARRDEVRLRLLVRGVVQGVGFRPAMYRLARELELCGWVRNTGDGVTIEVEGRRAAAEAMSLRLAGELPPRAVLHGLESTWLEPVGLGEFEILPSDGTGGAQSAVVPPDMATCADCLNEIFSETDRRHGYAFTNCTNCGPRFSIISGLPYDRPATTMRDFIMCADCAAEYADPTNRRFHAQPNACPVCGPRLWAQGSGSGPEIHGDPVEAAADVLEAGGIVALRGVGGFHLMCDARNAKAVARLRARKHREEKPFAVMFPDLDAVMKDCELSPVEARALQSPEAPIVLLMRRTDAARVVKKGDALAEGIAPGNPQVGALLPYSPLHHLLMRRLGFPLVATSGNLSDEPICTDNDEALERLAGIVDLFLLHDRPIERPVDDSVVRVAAGREVVFRRARGLAPLPLPLEREMPTVLALGAHMKNTIALTRGAAIFTSQHLGDLDSPPSRAAFLAAVDDMPRLLAAHPVAVACDMHPDYASTQHAAEMGLLVIAVQHHHAHVVSCMADNELHGEVLGVAWDGTGLGLDRTIWGGEFLLATTTGFRRVAALRSFRLPGGEAAARTPWRSALGAFHEVFGDAVFEQPDLACIRDRSAQEIGLLRRQFEAGLNVPVTTSAGRLFDAAASLSGLRQTTAFEGQSAMAFEFAFGSPNSPLPRPYPFDLRETQLSADAVLWNTQGADTVPFIEIDWRPALNALVIDARRGEDVRTISGRFHAGLAEAIVGVARKCQVERVVLSGGCFQNRLLLESTVDRLTAAGYAPFQHQRVPPNDGGIATGQALVAAATLLEV